jgi:predicted AAA+ superfamily ATPase
MDQQLVNDFLLEWRDKKLEEGIRRDLKVDNIPSRATIIIGPRRAGKTYFLFQIAEEMGRDDVLYLNFEDSRLHFLSFNEIRDVIRLYIEITSKEPKILLLDEIQNINRWEITVRELLDLRKYSIFITGSSSKLLSMEIATQLRGRSLTYMMLPFSFSEYLKAKKINANLPLTKDKEAILKNFLKDYLEWGGFPEVVINGKSRELILKDYNDLILFKDIIERNSMKNITLARFLLEQLLQNFASEISVNKMINKSNGISLSKDTTYSYVDKMQDSVAIFFLERYSNKAHERSSWPKKTYVCDTGLTKTVKFSEDIGKLMENAVFLELLRKKNRFPFLNLYYWKSLSGEVDFVLKQSNEVKELIQVTYASCKNGIYDREIKALTACSKLLNCNNLVIITWNYKSIIKADDKEIQCIPLLEWLLNS